MQVSGPTGCGKTYFLAELLRFARDKIVPTPQRIIWLYKRWQPLYDVIKNTVQPAVEFMKGIPLNLDQDSFLDSNKRNMVIMDDLSNEMAKDQRITDLFTEGSHHRNLSVIALNQNLYFNKNPTQRRNCHYLVLFNCPADRQSVMCLFRQMQPSRSKELLSVFEDAISIPYGFLLVDLKAATPEHLRMRTDVLSIKRTAVTNKDQSIAITQPEQILQEDIDANPTRGESTVDISTQTNSMASCDDCGIVFENSHDLQNHVKRWCPENYTLKRTLPNDESDEQTHTKKTKWDTLESDIDNTSGKDDSQEHEVYTDIADKVKSVNEQKWQEKVKKYEAEGSTKQEAEQKADRKLREDDLREFVVRYHTLISYILKLQGGYLHNKIVESVRDYMTRGVSRQRAIRMALRKYDHHFEEYFEDEENQQSDNASENEDDESVSTEQDFEEENSDSD